ncbi:hypothetical protein MT344_04110 [Clavibacter michiganensis subsp. phaseoli]|uniref:hypothetical protein n=1 Tax=Clavibacter phaseoli TaxID=1734031 RepID=UPI001FB2B471|nr:hypothetical protein [Clavibacter phaseoli]MCJ1710367.1 hypothetical protein [Clavibacter phaseoli]
MDLRTILVILTLLGFALTAGGLLEAALGARRTLKQEEGRVAKLKELDDAEEAERKTLPEDAEGAEAFYAKWTAEYAKHGLTRSSMGNMTDIPFIESARVVGLVLGSTVRGAWTAAAGLVVSTGASIWSFWL